MATGKDLDDLVSELKNFDEAFANAFANLSNLFQGVQSGLANFRKVLEGQDEEIAALERENEEAEKAARKEKKELMIDIASVLEGIAGTVASEQSYSANLKPKILALAHKLRQGEEDRHELFAATFSIK